ncbi:MAG: Fatty-acid--CoA ligase, partial [Mycobacterium sp.]|nr:Fatty-acid--CoA ligase [Mycobacterium sp.]
MPLPFFGNTFAHPIVWPKDAALTHWLNHSLVLASDYRVSNPERVGPLLERRQDALVDLGAH